MTEATLQALDGLRDLSMVKWYVIPLMAIVFYIYTKEIKLARQSGDWGAIYAGATVFGLDFLNETINGWVMVLSGRSALWTAPGDTALRTMVGWNIEIMFMFSILGILFYHALSQQKDRRYFGIPEMWFFAIGYTLLCVFIEVLLNIGGALVWEYVFWNRSFAGIWLILLFGYFHFFAGAIWVLKMKHKSQKIKAIGAIYGITIALNIFAMGIMGWVY